MSKMKNEICKYHGLSCDIRYCSSAEHSFRNGICVDKSNGIQLAMDIIETKKLYTSLKSTCNMPSAHILYVTQFEVWKFTHFRTLQIHPNQQLDLNIDLSNHYDQSSMMIHEAGGKNIKFQWQKAALFDIMAMNCKKQKLYNVRFAAGKRIR